MSNLGTHFELKHQKKIRELALRINSFQAKECFENLLPKEKKKLRDISYEMLDIANHYEAKRKYRNEDRRISYNFQSKIN